MPPDGGEDALRRLRFKKLNSTHSAQAEDYRVGASRKASIPICVPAEGSALPSSDDDSADRTWVDNCGFLTRRQISQLPKSSPSPPIKPSYSPLLKTTAKAAQNGRPNSGRASGKDPPRIRANVSPSQCLNKLATSRVTRSTFSKIKQNSERTLKPFAQPIISSKDTLTGCSSITSRSSTQASRSRPHPTKPRAPRARWRDVQEKISLDVALSDQSCGHSNTGSELNKPRASACTSPSCLSLSISSASSSCDRHGRSPVVINPSAHSSPDLLAHMRTDLSAWGIRMSHNIRGRIEESATHKVQAFDIPSQLPAEASPLVIDPKSLCPFCDEPLPQRPSEKLLQLLSYLKNKSNLKRKTYSTNPHALYLPFCETASCCALHRAERDIIPMGTKKGWPKQLDFYKLPKRIKRYFDYLSQVCTRQIPSTFLKMALEEWSKKGSKKLKNILNEMATFEVEQPGYYGVQGYEIIHDTLQQIFLSPAHINFTLKHASPLSADFYLRRVLVPETALCLIGEDLGLKPTDPKVKATLEESRAYGVAVFPDEEAAIVSSEDEDKAKVREPIRCIKSEKRRRCSSDSDIEIMPSAGGYEEKVAPSRGMIKLRRFYC